MMVTFMSKNKTKMNAFEIDNEKDKGKTKKISLGEMEALKEFQSTVALALLNFTGNLEDADVERRLASALLFLTHLAPFLDNLTC